MFCIFLVAFSDLNLPNKTFSIQLLVKRGRETGLNGSLCYWDEVLSSESLRKSFWEICLLIEPKRNLRGAITTAVMLRANRKTFLEGNAGGLKGKTLGQPVGRIVVLLL